MCYYISGTLPDDVDVRAVRKLDAPEGSSWRPLSNPHVQMQLPKSVAYYLVTGSVCDCKSALVDHLYERGRAPTLPKDAHRWSDAKKARWQAQRRDVEARRDATTHERLLEWQRYLQNLVRLLDDQPVGLLIHWYNGSVDNESFTVRMIEPVPPAAFGTQGFRSMVENCVYQFLDLDAVARDRPS